MVGLGLEAEKGTFDAFEPSPTMRHSGTRQNSALTVDCQEPRPEEHKHRTGGTPPVSGSGVWTAPEPVVGAVRAGRSLGVSDTRSVFGRWSVEVVVKLGDVEILEDFEIFPR